MARVPDEKIREAAKKNLDPKAVLNAVINDMHDPELEKQLVEAGVARYVEEGPKDND